MFPITVQGIVPKMPCMIITLNVGMVRNFARSRTSSTIAENHLHRRAVAGSAEAVEVCGALFTGGSCRKRASRAATAMAMRPMTPKATRQPLRPKIVFRERLPTMMVDRNIPTRSEHCTRPKTFPRLPSEVTSAMMPLEIGRSAARRPPTTARKTIMLHKAVVVANAMVMSPCPKAPMTRMVLRRRIPRSARMPQMGAAKLMVTPWATVKYARSVSSKPISLCKANIDAGNT
mmetsp:Transcript_22288/g.50766  ORF Transcript_22288/g.50766 Transcript_22288/m.50766 type:complete len:232 (+) Transcript_22288:822-1517(+)